VPGYRIEEELGPDMCGIIDSNAGVLRRCPVPDRLIRGKYLAGSGQVLHVWDALEPQHACSTYSQSLRPRYWLRCAVAWKEAEDLRPVAEYSGRTLREHLGLARPLHRGLTVLRS
jgi:hypothetical protein